MPAHHYFSFDPLFSPDHAAAMVRLCERFGSYGMYSAEPTFEGIGQGFPARYDAVRNFIRSGGRFGRSEPMPILAARTNYFRETYAYGEETYIDGIEPFLHHEGFIDAARKLHGRPLIVPAIVFANFLVPGQELAVHTDVPEFRGINRRRHPQWLVVAMRHSGLFEDWRMPIATGIAWFHDCSGGELAFYPDGPDAPPLAHQVRYNTALLLDTDSVFHGVDRVAETATSVEHLRPGMHLHFDGTGQWSLRDGDRVVGQYPWDALRFSVSWKAYCFHDENERQRWFEHRDDLTVATVVDRLVEDLRQRGTITGARPPDQELIEILIDSYIRYPRPQATAEATAG